MAKKNKKSKANNLNSGCGCSTLLVFIIGASIVYFLVTSGIRLFISGFITCFPFFLLFIIVILLFRIYFHIIYRKPLTYEQIVTLSKRRTADYIQNKYSFKNVPVTINSIFKSNLDVTGRWYEIEEPLDSFPSYISALLEGKHHEWVVIALEKDDLVCNMWVNKGIDNQSVSLSCDLFDVVQKCRQVGAYTVLRFHNHPNSDPEHYTTLVASEQDKISASSCSEYVNKKGINWIDFVCARGKFLQFFSSYSETFECRDGSVSDIIDKIAITPQMDYELQKEYHNFGKFSRVFKNKYVFLAIVVICIIVGYLNLNFSSVEDFPSESKISESIIADESEHIESSTQSEEFALTEDWVTVSLDDFEYLYENDGITLEEYTGNATCIIIPAYYNVEGTDLPVLKLDDSFKKNLDVKNIIVSEGITTILSSTFDDCLNLKHLYIPSTMTFTDSALKSAPDGEILYYGGTQNQWEEFDTVSRSEINFKLIVYNATPDDCMENKDTYVDDIANEEIENGYTPLSDFSYDVKNKGITLKDYSGEDDCVIIASSYTVDNMVYPVLELNNTFAFSNAETVIISEGVQSVTKAIFNASDITIIYLPASLVDVPEKFWGYLHDIDTIYYRGTESQFLELYGGDRWDLDVKHMVYEATPEDVLSTRD